MEPLQSTIGDIITGTAKGTTLMIQKTSYLYSLKILPDMGA